MGKKSTFNNRRLHCMRKVRGLLKKRGHNINGAKQKYIIRLFAKELGLTIPDNTNVLKWVMELYLSGEVEELKRETRYGLLGADWNRLCKKVYKNHENKCVKCGTFENLSVDHILPISIYPELGAEYDNLQILCRSCNSSKGNKVLTKYLKV